MTLKKQVELIENYGSLVKAFESVKDFKSLCNLIWLLIDRSEYEYKFKAFYFDAYLELQNNKNSMIKALYECQEKSMPKIKNNKFRKELEKINAAKDEKPVCYGEIYDVFAKRYGYSLDEFYNLTTRQMYAMLKIIDKKTYDELSVKASLHGVKLKERIQYNDEISDEDAERHDKEAADFLKKAREEYKEKMKNG